MYHYKSLIDDKINWDGLEFPLATYDVKKFEELNEDISVNVCSLDGVEDGYGCLIKKILLELFINHVIEMQNMSVMHFI